MAYTDDRSPGSDEPQDINPLALAAGLIRTDIVDEGTAAKAWIEFTTLQNAVKRRKAEIEQDLIDYMTGANIAEINIGGGDDGARFRIRKVKSKTEKWKAQELMDTFSIPREVQAIFSSPKFKKGELTVLLGDRGAVDDFVETTWSEDVEIKEIDTEAVKKFARAK